MRFHVILQLYSNQSHSNSPLIFNSHISLKFIKFIIRFFFSIKARFGIIFGYYLPYFISWKIRKIMFGDQQHFWSKVGSNYSILSLYIWPNNSIIMTQIGIILGHSRIWKHLRISNTTIYYTHLFTKIIEFSLCIMHNLSTKNT